MLRVGGEIAGFLKLICVMLKRLQHNSTQVDICMPATAALKHNDSCTSLQPIRFRYANNTRNLLFTQQTHTTTITALSVITFLFELVLPIQE